MDSLTQIVLGAAVGEAVLGKKVGNKAMLYGAIAGTIPDLDVLARFFVDTVTATEWHRGFSHSIFFSIMFAPILGWLVWKLNRKSKATFKDWTSLMFWGLFTHPILDAFTTWGTQLFWPFKTRLAFQNIFVIDPLYTLPFLAFLILAMCQKRTSPKRTRYNNLGLILSTTYLLITLILKGFAYKQFITNLNTQGIVYSEMDIRPAPFGTVLWTANIDTKDAYLIGNYSFFDSQPIEFVAYEKNHELLGSLATNDKIARLINIAEGWYTISQENEKLFFNDLRFGLLSLKPDETRFAFTYEISSSEQGLQIHETPKSGADADGLFESLWNRMWGNTNSFDNTESAVLTSILKKEYKNIDEMFEYPSSRKVVFNIEVEKSYTFGEPIDIYLVWTNISTVDEKISLKEDMGIPVGIHASIFNEKGESIVEHPSKRVWSSNMISQEDIREEEISLKPRQIIKHKIALTSIPVFEKNVKVISQFQLARGSYSAQLSYNYLYSDTVTFEIK